MSEGIHVWFFWGASEQYGYGMVWCDVVWRGGAGRCGGVVWCIPTLFKEDTTTSDIIDLVKKNQIFGAVECDIMVPETIIL